MKKAQVERGLKEAYQELGWRRHRAYLDGDKPRATNIDYQLVGLQIAWKAIENSTGTELKLY